MASTGIKHKAYLKGLTISFKNLPLEMVGDLQNIKVSGSQKAEAFVTLTPDGHDIKRVNMFYFDAETKQGPWTKAQCRMGKELDNGELVVVDPNEVKEAKKSDLPERVLELEVFDREEVDAYLCGGANRYVFAPSGSSSLYGILQQFLSGNPHLVLIGRVNLGARSNEKIMHLSVGVSGQLVVEELIYPEDIIDFDRAVWPEVKPTVFSMSEDIIKASVSTFNPDDWKKESRNRLEQLVLSAQSGGTYVPKVVEDNKGDDSGDLEALLAATLAQVRAAKGE